MVHSKIEDKIAEVTLELRELVERWRWAGPEERVRILTRRMDLQDLLHDLLEAERRSPFTSSDPANRRISNR